MIPKDLSRRADRGHHGARVRARAGGAPHRAHRVPASRSRAVSREAGRDGRGRAPGHGAARGRLRRQVAGVVRPGAQRVPVRRAGVRGQPPALRGSPQQLPERGAGAAHGHPDHAVGRLHGGGAAGRPPHRGRELPRPLPGALQGRGRTRRRRPHHRPVPPRAPC